MKIKVTLEFDVDLDVWANEYGLDADQAKTDARDFVPFIVGDYIAAMPHVKDGLIDLVKKN